MHTQNIRNSVRVSNMKRISCVLYSSEANAEMNAILLECNILHY